MLNVIEMCELCAVLFNPIDFDAGGSGHTADEHGCRSQA